MNAWLLVLTLQAAPAPVLQPDPGGWKRLQPRHLEASSFLANGWNRFEQNYLPMYVADDDPSTAWVEGAKGPGIGERLSWFGPHLSKARAFRIFVRSGYQKSRVLFEANVRPRKVRFEPLVATEVGATPGGKPVEVELADVLGWQKVELPVPPAVGGFQLTVISVYPGTKYEDLCISDVQVYVDGDDAYSAPAEQAAADHIRAAVAERQAAAIVGTQASVELKAQYHERSLGSLKAPPDNAETGAPASATEILAQAGGPMEEVLVRARAALAAYQGAPENSLTQQSVRLATTAPGLGSRAEALAGAARGEPALAKLLRYLALKDFAVFEGTGAERRVDPVSAASDALSPFIGSKDPGCVAKCRPVLARLGKPGQAALACIGTGATQDTTPTDCEGICAGGPTPCDIDSKEETRGTYALGTIASPRALFWRVTTVTGDRDAVVVNEDELLAYADGLATSLVSVRTDHNGFRPWDNAHGSIYLFDWDRSGPMPVLTRVIRVEIGAQVTRVSAFEAA